MSQFAAYLTIFTIVKHLYYRPLVVKVLDRKTFIVQATRSQSFKLYLNVNFLTSVLDILWQLETVVFLYWCLICDVLLKWGAILHMSSVDMLQSGQNCFCQFTNQGPFSQHFLFFLTYVWAQQVRVLEYKRPERPACDKTKADCVNL